MTTTTISATEPQDIVSGIAVSQDSGGKGAKKGPGRPRGRASAKNYYDCATIDPHILVWREMPRGPARERYFERHIYPSIWSLCKKVACFRMSAHGADAVEDCHIGAVGHVASHVLFVWDPTRGNSFHYVNQSVHFYCIQESTKMTSPKRKFITSVDPHQFVEPNKNHDVMHRASQGLRTSFDSTDDDVRAWAKETLSRLQRIADGEGRFATKDIKRRVVAQAIVDELFNVEGLPASNGGHKSVSAISMHKWLSTEGHKPYASATYQTIAHDIRSIKLVVEQLERADNLRESRAAALDAALKRAKRAASVLKLASSMTTASTQRIVIIGPPSTGKTTMSSEYSCFVRHSDDLLNDERHKFDWHQQSQKLADEMRETTGPWVFEGVRLVHALRKALKQHPDIAPCDKVIVLTAPHEPLSTTQAGFGKGIMKVWHEIEAKVRQLGVEIEER